MAKAAYHLANTQKGDILLNPFPLVNMASIGGFLFNWLICKGKLIQHHPFDLNIYLSQLSEGKSKLHNSSTGNYEYVIK